MTLRLLSAALALLLAGQATANDLCDGPVRASGTPRVVDGDTLAFARADGGEDVARLWGIDAPEDETRAGQAAERYVEHLVDGTTVTCVWAPDGQDRDRWNRMIAVCCIDGRDIAEGLVDAGHAVDSPEYSGGHYAW